MISQMDFCLSINYVDVNFVRPKGRPLNIRIVRYISILYVKFHPMYQANTIFLRQCDVDVILTQSYFICFIE